MYASEATRRLSKNERVLNTNLDIYSFVKECLKFWASAIESEVERRKEAGSRS